MTQFFGLDSPEFMVVSATLHLPIPHPRVTEGQLRIVDRNLRELTYHPECFLGDSTEETVSLVENKRNWIRREPTRENARERCHAIRRVNEALQPLLAERRHGLSAEREGIVRSLGAEAVLSSREYGFCLFPEKELRDFLLALLPKIA